MEIETAGVDELHSLFRSGYVPQEGIDPWRVVSEYRAWAAENPLGGLTPATMGAFLAALAGHQTRAAIIARISQEEQAARKSATEISAHLRETQISLRQARAQIDRLENLRAAIAYFGEPLPPGDEIDF